MDESKNVNKVIITGCPGTGKTTLADEIGKCLDLEVIHIDQDYIKNNGLSKGYDEIRESIEVDLEKLKEKLKNKEGVIESHLLCEFNLKKSIVIVLRCDTGELKKRLEKRGYSEDKIKENLESEIFNYCGEEARSNYGENKVYELDTTDKTVEENKSKIVNIIKSNQS